MSVATTSTASPGTRKTYVCTAARCSKSFLRAEHLSRHTLNHQAERIFACTLCPKEFVRLDLYQRHQKRHENGMLYRKVGGVVEQGRRKTARVQQQRQLSLVGPDQTSRRSDSIESAFVPPEKGAPNECVLSPVVHETPGEDETLDAYDEPPTTFAFDHSTRIGDAPITQKSYQAPQVDMTNTLFHDVSANGEDLPDGLDWFFESPHNDFLMSDGFNMSAFGPFIEAAPSIYEPLFYAQETDFTPHSSSTFEWSIAQPRLLLALSSLPQDILESRFFHTSNLCLCFDLFFDKYHNHFPFLHRPTFTVSEANPMLLAALLSLGSTLADDAEVYQIGQRIHESLRWIIFGNGSFEPPAPLWCLQALLLVQAQGKMFSTIKQHQMAHIFHGAILTMMQRSWATDTARISTSTSTSLSRVSWQQWAEDESFRRTSFFAFLMDAQHSSVFGHSPVLSVSDVRLPLPCAESLWECPTVEAWAEMLPNVPKSPQFLPTLKSLLGKSLVPSICSNFSRLILLHGLMSLTSHLLARDATTLGIENGNVGSRESGAPIVQIEDWKEIMSKAIGRWAFCLYSSQPSLCLEAAQPLHRMAYITLYTRISDIDAVAKDPGLISGEPLLSRQYPKVEARLRQWSKTDAARQAVLHSLLMVKDIMFSRRNYNAKHDNIAPRPWCLYHAVLVLWTFGLLTVTDTASTREGHNTQSATTVMEAEEYVVHVMCLLQSGGSLAPSIGRTKGLLYAVMNTLKESRWELLQDAHKTLEKLITTTL